MRKISDLLGAMAFYFTALLIAEFASDAKAAYHHMGEMDSDYFLESYPDASGTKLDSCTLCHRGGSYSSGTKTITLGSCQWCHYQYGYDASGHIMETLNAFGMAYHHNGSSKEALAAIKDSDSDSDGFTNAEEIAAVRFPGDPDDDPTKVPAPFAVYTLEQIETMPVHTQFMLMNTHKSGDSYTEYMGVPMEYLMEKAGALPSATGIDVYAPDGYSTFHPLDLLQGYYHARGTYPAATYFYDKEADSKLTAYGWCDYGEPSAAGRTHADPIEVEGGLKMLLAYRREGKYLDPGRLNPNNKIDGEGPFRVVPPQRIPGPPDQASNSKIQNVIWPFDATETQTDHNAGFSTRSATIIKVGPLPEGTTDIDTLEAGWGYVDAGKVVVYGAIDPIPTVLSKLTGLKSFVSTLESGMMKGKNMPKVYAKKIDAVIHQVKVGAMTGASDKITEDLLPKTDGMTTTNAPDTDDWVMDSAAQRRIYWSLKELLVLLAIKG